MVHGPSYEGRPYLTHFGPGSALRFPISLKRRSFVPGKSGKLPEGGPGTAMIRLDREQKLVWAGRPVNCLGGGRRQRPGLPQPARQGTAGGSRHAGPRSLDDDGEYKAPAGRYYYARRGGGGWPTDRYASSSEEALRGPTAVLRRSYRCSNEEPHYFFCGNSVIDRSSS